MNRSTFIHITGFLVILLFFIFFNDSMALQTSTSGWKAPASADKLKNPFKDDPDAWKKVEDVYKINCNICHGKGGEGDGLGGIALKPRPANLIAEDVLKQTDGAIYWKITNGKPPMASYKEVLTEEERWLLVNFIRNLAKQN